MEKLNSVLTKQKYHKARIKFIDSDYAKFRKSKEFDAIIKETRASLREVYGVFINNDFSKRKKLLEKLKEDKSIEAHNELLRLHRSSNERLSIYGEVYEKIFEITGKPNKILDLACGLNPLSFPYLGCNPAYIASDISEEDMQFITEYFALMKIKGATKALDLVKANPADLERLSTGVDVTFLFKALDSLETVEWNASKRVINALKSKWIVISFATRSIGGKKPIKKEKRGWFEKFLAEKNITPELIELDNEMFYVFENTH